MDWQFIAMWLVVGAVVIWIAARIIKRRTFRKNDRNNNGPSCCR